MLLVHPLLPAGPPADLVQLSLQTAHTCRRENAASSRDYMYTGTGLCSKLVTEVTVNVHDAQDGFTCMICVEAPTHVFAGTEAKVVVICDASAAAVAEHSSTWTSHGIASCVLHDIQRAVWTLTHKSFTHRFFICRPSALVRTEQQT